MPYEHQLRINDVVLDKYLLEYTLYNGDLHLDLNTLDKHDSLMIRYRRKLIEFDKSYDFCDYLSVFHNYIGSALKKYISDHKRFFYKKFEKEYLDSTIESEYDKLKGNVVNYFTEKPLEDIFEISFTRYLSDEIGIVLKHFKKLLLEAKSIAINTSVKFEFTNKITYSTTLFDIIRQLINKLDFKIDHVSTCTILLGYNEVENTEGELNFNFDYSLTGNDFRDVISFIILKSLRMSFVEEYEKCIYEERNKYLKNICVDIKAFYVRNALTYKSWHNEILQDLVSLQYDSRPETGHISNLFDEALNNVGCLDEGSTTKFESYSDFASKMFAEWYTLLSKINGKSRTSALKYANTYIDVEDLNNDLQKIIEKLKPLYESFSNFYTNYCKYGKKDYNTPHRFLNALYHHYESECFDTIYVDRLKMELNWPNGHSCSEKRNKDKSYNDIKSFVKAFELIDSKYEKSIEDGGYGDNLDTLIKDLDELFTQFKDFEVVYYDYIKTICSKILKWLREDLNGVIALNLEYEPLQQFMNYIRSDSSVSSSNFFVPSNKIVYDIGLMDSFRYNVK